jgi:hypothetical protein
MFAYILSIPYRLILTILWLTLGCLICAGLVMRGTTLEQGIDCYTKTFEDIWRTI